MTRGNTDPTRRRRMAGWAPVENKAEAQPQASDPMSKPTAAAVAPSPTPARPVTESASATTGARRRMGAESTVAPQPSAETAPMASRRRMGEAEPSAPTPTEQRTRMTSGTAAPAEKHHTAASTSDTGEKAPPVTSPTRPAEHIETKGPIRVWVKPVLTIMVLVVTAVVVVLLARWLRTLEPIQEFIATYSGHTRLPATAPVGLPRWIGWQHFLNMFFIVLIVRTGLQVRTERKPPGHWTPKKNSFFAPKGATPKKVSLSQWLHQSLDVLWVLNGIVFIILLFPTGQWMRIVPMSWDIFPHMASTMLQYASLDWPLENGWVHYNAMQVMAYFITVFIAAPLAIFSGIRISTWWPDQNATLNKIYPVEVARTLHFPVMLYFVAFTIVHVFLVFFTGALRNLNHMYTSRNVVDAWGLIIFLASLIVMAAAWFLTKPMFITSIAAKSGKISK